MNDDASLPTPPKMLTMSGWRALAASTIRTADRAVPAALVADLLDATAAAVLRVAGVDDETLHAAVCTTPGLPPAWRVETARDAEVPVVPVLLDRLRDRAFPVEHAVLDKGYDVAPVYDGCDERGLRPIVPLRKTPAVLAGKHRPPSCEHGTWTFAGSDAKRGASKWRCPAGECKPASVWIKADRLHPLIPRGTDRFRALYRQRGAVEREFGRLKHEWGLAPLRVRRIEPVRLHADLTILARLACALAAARAVPLAA